ncbi:DUF4253 domain-containing protein [Streptomyces sp. NPDC096339]|uniref:DUF4253 domain-containing protein n=1 Tax=Streptomyces sp. NPDC096339 TaxID=3366086 RepID=UPI003826982A
MPERTADQILGERWQSHAQEAVADAGEDHPGRDEVVELFGDPAPFTEVVAPFGTRWPGLAAAPPRPWPDAEQLAARVLGELSEIDGHAEEGYLLDAVYRGTDVRALVEAHGPGGCRPYDDAELCTVLRSWEERFGVRLLGLGEDRLTVSVAAPVGTTREAEAIAAEHFAFAPDNITQGWDETLRAYAANQVLGKQVWSFWWD